LVFPAHAGMNRKGDWAGVGVAGVPRTRGDEPRMPMITKRAPRCSPHTRG